MMGPKNGIAAACAYIGSTNEHSTNRSVNKGIRERIFLSYRLLGSLGRLFPHLRGLVSLVSAGPPGIGPGLSVLETDVLPLYDGPVRERYHIRLTKTAFRAVSDLLSALFL